MRSACVCTLRDELQDEEKRKEGEVKLLDLAAERKALLDIVL